MRGLVVTWIERLLGAVTIAILLSLALVVVLAIVFRYAGSSLVWYDEVASVQLAWLTYYGAAFAALKRAHLGFSGLVEALPAGARGALFWLAEALVATFFVAMTWAGWRVLDVMRGETLVSLEWVPLTVTQSVVPIGCALFVLAQLLSAPDAWRRMAADDGEEASA
ncbi:MAG: TRAP transporter small permease subunit [Chromatiales bacterium]|nr:TRAP transporter small permease subunit [Chromatiales bacterium]